MGFAVVVIVNGMKLKVTQLPLIYDEPAEPVSVAPATATEVEDGDSVDDRAPSDALGLQESKINGKVTRQNTSGERLVGYMQCIVRAPNGSRLSCGAPHRGRTRIHRRS